MSHTFDVRFARSTGFAALLEAPNNSFRWKGAARLLVEPHGLGIAFERMLLGVRLRTIRIPVDEHTAVFREGEALRFEFTLPGAEREVLPVWTHTREAAAEIVRLLSTRKTVELEDAPAHGREFRPDLRLITLFGLPVLLAGVVLSTMLGLRTPNAAATREALPAATTVPLELPDERALLPPELLVPEEPVKVEMAPPAIDEDATATRPRATRTTHADAANTVVAADPVAAAAALAVDAADREQAARAERQREVGLFMIEADGLRLAYRDLFSDAGPAKLRDLEDRWWQLSQRIYSGELPSTEPMRTQELLISQSWRRALSMQASRRSSPPQVKEEIAFALMLSEEMKKSAD